MGENFQKLAKLSRFVGERFGLDYPPERFPELMRGLKAAAAELGCSDLEICARNYLTSPTEEELSILAAHLTVGETYFFRDHNAFERIRHEILPQLISMGDRHQCLRLWSAGCCSGEEAYSLAIVAREVIPKSWHISILGTDINPQFLAKARRGVFGNWSFRDVPENVKNRYFQCRGENQWEICAEIRRMVRFEYLNLAETVYPSVMNGTAGLDLILCRNVMIYFQPLQIAMVSNRFYESLRTGGFLLVAPSEAGQEKFQKFIPFWAGQTLFYEKRPQVAPRSADRAVNREVPGLQPSLGSVPKEGKTPPKMRMVEMTSGKMSGNSRDISEVRSLANSGELEASLEKCDQLVKTEPLVASNHYLRAMILEELGMDEEARKSLLKARYLDPGLVVVHFALANLARRKGLDAEARKHLRNTLTLASRYPKHELLPETEGLSAGRLVEVALAMSEGAGPGSQRGSAHQ